MQLDNLKRPTLFMATVNKVLIVDDNPVNREILEEYIDSVGFEPILAENGQDALTIIKETPPSLVLLDILMPIMDGTELLKILKSDTNLKDIPVVMISAIQDMNKVLECIEMGANDYLHKPVNFNLLSARITSCINQKRDRDQENFYRKKLENAVITINQQNNELQNANKMITRYSRICSHELKNKLCPILAYSDLLLLEQKVENDAEIQTIKALKVIYENACQMKELLNDAQDYQNILNDQVHIDVSPFDVNNLLESTLCSYELLFQEKKISIKTSLDPDLPVGLGDKIRMTQVLGNFLTNALKYSEPQTQVQIRSLKVNNRIKVEIEDEGPGIRTEERAQLFKEHPKISNKPTANEESTGLGLAITKKLVELQKGKIGVYFPKEKGSVFWFQLPLADEDVSKK